jgi:hypothetical protein
VIVPPWNADGDPTPAGGAAGGAVLTIFNANDGSDKVVFTLPAARWTRSGSAAAPRYKYSDKLRQSSPISSVSLRAGKLSVRGRGAALYPLGNAPQGAMAVRLELGARFGSCARAPARTPVEMNDTPGKFTGERHTPPPVFCPPRP